MIAAPRPSAASNSRDRFLVMLPLIRRLARRAFRYQLAEERDELVAEVVANAYCAFAGLVRRGKADFAYATPLARYAIRQVRTGRRVGQPLNSQDIMSPSAPLGRQRKLQHLHQYDSDLGVCREILIEDNHAGPAETAAARIDFAAWLRGLPRRDRQIAKALANGETTGTAAALFGISQGRVSQLRRQLCTSWRVFQGEVAALE